ncbi:hypothetical protein JMJ99_00005 [Companilactobacillus zhachilii]|uniref:hypothetical protein n=1 Tax=Companilactobacillus zhachilii TaxID=2304606 RepID=UPI001921B040|nr:hypothetical protein [Companilactobacillus zhachilii]MBL3529736.1 hypothetical protein [Companilactobacillus zhachilii]
MDNSIYNLIIHSSIKKVNLYLESFLFSYHFKQWSTIGYTSRLLANGFKRKDIHVA